MTHDRYLLTINVPANIAEPVIDCVLAAGDVRCFSSYPVNDHDQLQRQLSIAEQVSGRRKNIRLQLVVEKKLLAPLITALKNEFSGSGLHYWVIPIIEHAVV